MEPRTKRILVMAGLFILVFVIVKSALTWILEGGDAAVTQLPLAFAGALVGAVVFGALMWWKGKR